MSLRPNGLQNTPREKNPLGIWLTFFIAFNLLLGTACRRERMADGKIEQHVYVWQEVWNEDVKVALKAAEPCIDGCQVFAGEITHAGQRVEMNPKQIDWQALAKINIPVTLVVRFGSAFSKVIASEPVPETAQSFRRWMNDLLAKCRSVDLPVAGFQLDYDCPTSKLADYGALIRELERQNPDVPISITALPAWLGSAEFPKLIKPLPYYVLQVHSLEKPKNIDQPVSLFDLQMTQGYLQRAAAYEIPFYLALPTYGYSVIYDQEGNFVGLQAEGAASVWKPGYEVRLVMADHRPLAELIRNLQIERPALCRGVIWFRLPVPTDTLNWSWPALSAVMDGREPVLEFKAEVFSPSQDLYEIHIFNSGERNHWGTIRFKILCPQKSILAYDILGDFHESENVHEIMGPAPRCGESVTAAWFRLRPDDGAGGNRLQVSQVESIP